MPSEAKRACGGGESAKQTKAALGGTGLMSMPEDVTLNIVSRLDFLSLAATKRVCHRLSRIAHDQTIFRRVTLVICDQFDCNDPKINTNCAQLGLVLLEDEEEGGIRANLHRVLSGLVNGGAALSALDFSSRQDCFGDILEEILDGLPALLKKLRVKLRSLAVTEVKPEQLVELMRSQPSLEVLDVGCFPPEAVELVCSASNLRHLMLDCHDNNKKLDPELLRSVVPQLRSLFLHTVWTGEDEEASLPRLLSVLRVAGEGRLLLRAVGRVDGWHYGRSYHVAFAVNDFRRKELGWHFDGPKHLKSSWDDAKHRRPTPSLDYDEATAFLRRTGEQQKKEEKAKEEANEEARQEKEAKEEANEDEEKEKVAEALIST